MFSLVRQGSASCQSFSKWAVVREEWNVYQLKRKAPKGKVGSLTLKINIPKSMDERVTLVCLPRSTNSQYKSYKN